MLVIVSKTRDTRKTLADELMSLVNHWSVIYSFYLKEKLFKQQAKN